MSKRDWLKHLGFTTAVAIATSKTTSKMNDEEYKQLESLLGKLQLEIGGNKFCILPGYIHDGYHIGVYKSGTGEPVTSATGVTIKEVVEKLNQQPKNQ